MKHNFEQLKGDEKRIHLTLMLETFPFECHGNSDAGFTEKENSS